MEKYYDVIERALGLLDIIDEGLTHIQKQLAELMYEEAFVLLEDSAEAMESIQNSLQPVVEELKEPGVIEEKAKKMMKSFALVVKECERNNMENVQEAMELSLEPCFKIWKLELEKQLRPLIAS